MSGVSVYVESPSGAFLRDAQCDLAARTKSRCWQRGIAGKPLRTVVCTRCGLISTNRSPVTKNSPTTMHEYRHAYHGERQPSAKRVLRAWNVGRAIYQRVQSFVHPGDRVFEIGAGLGCTVKAFALEGFEASGIEPGVEFQGFSRGTLHADIENARLEDLAPVPSYDFVLLVQRSSISASPPARSAGSGICSEPRGSCTWNVPMCTDRMRPPVVCSTTRTSTISLPGH